MIGYSRAFNELYGPKPIERKFRMNERIKELAEQAWVYQVRVLNEPDGSRTYTEKEKVFDKEKFAELIVGECMRMCDVAAIGYESHGHMKEANGCYSAKEYIEEHFGVEE